MSRSRRHALCVSLVLALGALGGQGCRKPAQRAPAAPPAPATPRPPDARRALDGARPADAAPAADAARPALDYSREHLARIHKLTKDTLLFDYDGDGDDDVAIIAWPKITVLVADGDRFKPLAYTPCPTWDLAAESLQGYWVDKQRLVLYLSGPGPSGMSFIEVAAEGLRTGSGCHGFGCSGSADDAREVEIAGRRYGCSFDECVLAAGKARCVPPLRRPQPVRLRGAPPRPRTD